MNNNGLTHGLFALILFFCVSGQAAENDGLKLGDDEAKVISLLGAPKGKLEVNGLKTYYYPNGLVTLKNNKIQELSLQLPQQTTAKQAQAEAQEAIATGAGNNSPPARDVQPEVVPAPAANPTRPAAPASTPVKEPVLHSDRPLYFRLAFGMNGASFMLGVLDESRGAGAGYDTVHLDENMNNDLTDDAPKSFSTQSRVLKDRPGLEANFEFKGPFGKNGKARYTLQILAVHPSGAQARPVQESTLMWHLYYNEWTYMFINGRMSLYSSAEAALNNTPVRLGGNCSWDISSRLDRGKVMMNAAAKDENGCRLRTVSGSGPIVPMLTLLQGGRAVMESKMEFG